MTGIYQSRVALKGLTIDIKIHIVLSTKDSLTLDKFANLISTTNLDFLRFGIRIHQNDNSDPDPFIK